MNTTKKANKSRLTGENRTKRQKASDTKRAEKIKATRASRKNSDAITRELKIDWSQLSQRKRRLIERAGHECNWLYNDIIRYINETDIDENGETVNKNDLKNYDTKIKRVRVKYGDEYRWRQLKVLSAQMRQAVYQQVWAALKALSTKKAKGEKVGRLRYRKYSPDMCGIRLNQFGQTYKFVNKERTKIRIQGPIGIVTVHGAEDLVDHEGRPIPDECFATAVLCSDALGTYIKPTMFVPKWKHEPTGVIGAYDLNVSNTFTRVDSTGKHDDIVAQFDESKRSKAARTANNKWLRKSEELYGKSGKRSSKRQLRIIEREAAHVSRRKRDFAAKEVHFARVAFDVVCVQDDDVHGWYSDGYSGGKLFRQPSGLIKSGLKNLPGASVVSRFTPTTKVCAHCGYVCDRSIKPGKKTWVCPRCGTVLDRQSNAAFVILALGLSQYVQRYASDRLIDDYARVIAPVFLPSGSAHTVVSWASSFDSVFQKEWSKSKRRREILTAVRDGCIRGWCGCGASDAVRLCLVQIHRLACLSPLLHADKYRAICTETLGALASRGHEANGASPEAQGFSLG